MNLNQLAVRLSELEGKKQQVDIAQIKEVLKCLGVVLSGLSASESFETVSKLVERGDEARAS